MTVTFTPLDELTSQQLDAVLARFQLVSKHHNAEDKIKIIQCIGLFDSKLGEYESSDVQVGFTKAGVFQDMKSTDETVKLFENTCACNTCGRKVDAKDLGFRCSECTQYFHNKCTSSPVTKEVFEKIKITPDWVKVLCPKCTATNHQSEERLENMKDKIVEINDKLNHVSETVRVDKKENTKGWSQIVADGNQEVVPALKDIMVEAMNKTKKDEADQQQRAKNIIIYNVKESTAKEVKDKKKDDESHFKQICETIEITYLEDSDVTKIIRVGEKKGNEPRPLLVCFSDQLHKDSFMANLTKLKNTEFKTISVRHDMNKAEREITRNLSTEAKTKNSQRSEEDLENFIFRVRGPPGYQMIKKIKIRR